MTNRRHIYISFVVALCFRGIALAETVDIQPGENPTLRCSTQSHCTVTFSPGEVHQALWITDSLSFGGTVLKYASGEELLVLHAKRCDQKSRATLTTSLDHYTFTLVSPPCDPEHPWNSDTDDGRLVPTKGALVLAPTVSPALPSDGQRPERFATVKARRRYKGPMPFVYATEDSIVIRYPEPTVPPVLWQVGPSGDLLTASVVTIDATTYEASSFIEQGILLPPTTKKIDRPRRSPHILFSFHNGRVQ